MQKKRCLDKSSCSIDKNLIKLIANYAGPNLWLYWIKNDRIYHDEFKHSKVIVAGDYKEACRLVFDENIKHIFKDGLVSVGEILSEQIRIQIGDDYTIPDCETCVSFINKSSKYRCARHQQNVNTGYTRNARNARDARDTRDANICGKCERCVQFYKSEAYPCINHFPSADILKKSIYAFDNSEEEIIKMIERLISIRFAKLKKLEWRKW